jgi:GWxTD domain-containing protein
LIAALRVDFLLSNLEAILGIWGCRVMRASIFSTVLLIGLEPACLAKAQDETSELVRAAAELPQSVDSSSSQQPCFAAQGGLREADAIASLPVIFRYWLAEDAAYIIASEERCAFLHLASDQERQQFVDQFWLRRAYDPESLDNDFKQEHYRRIVFANERFGTNVPGWRTDRGRVYITFGPPDKIESHGEGSRDEDREGGKRREKWHYMYLEGLGENVDLEFVDPSHSGDYGLLTQIQVKNEPPYNLPGVSRQDRDVASEGVQHIVAYVGPMPSPKIKFKDLEAMVVARIQRDQVHFSYTVECTKATHASTMVHIAVEIPTEQLIPEMRDGEQVGGAGIFGRVSKPSGWVVETFERAASIQELEHLGQATLKRETIVALEPGSYVLAIAVKDIASGNAGLRFATLQVPRYDDLCCAP